MRNTLKLFGIIALVAVIGFSFAACGGDEDDDLTQLKVTVNGLGAYNGSATQITLFNPNSTPDDRAAFAMGTISGGSITYDILDWDEEKPFYKTGTYDVVLRIGGENPTWRGQIDGKVFTATTTITFSEFTEI
jgi:hypothetical protein